jgi:hypothetical protein
MAGLDIRASVTVAGRSGCGSPARSWGASQVSGPGWGVLSGVMDSDVAGAGLRMGSVQ